MACACETFFLRSTGKKKDTFDIAEKMFKIDAQILRNLSNIAAKRGGPTQARKFDWDATMIDLTDEELNWVEATVRILIRRKAEYDADPSAMLKQITMADIK